jgi:hypothetical protein
LRKTIRKYFVPSLALLLILSNFSFATNIMLCGMSDSQSKCECKHKVNQKFSGLSFNKVKKSCCNEKSVELTNSNQLQTVKKDCTDKCVSQVILMNSDILFSSAGLNGFSNASLREQIPKPNIPILVSSLLI